MSADHHVDRFVNALADYRTAQGEQGMMLATRLPADLGEAASEVRDSLRALIADLNA